MQQLGTERLHSYYHDNQTTADQVRDQSHIWRGEGHFVSSYDELLAKLAEVQYLNPNYIIMFRGQSRDYRHGRGHSYLKPSIFRSNDGKYPGHDELRRRFRELSIAEEVLVGCMRSSLLVHDPLERIARYRIVRWAILQHYEIVPTPLLDVTTSARIAASFAHPNDAGDAFLFALAIPNISSAVTSNADAGLQVIRLASVCPPQASRPHYQEGYLLGQYPEIDSFDQKSNFSYNEMDFGSRLIAKFRFRAEDLWTDDIYPRVNRDFLYPLNDPFLQLVERVKDDLPSALLGSPSAYFIGDRAFR